MGKKSEEQANHRDVFISTFKGLWTVNECHELRSSAWLEFQKKNKHKMRIVPHELWSSVRSPFEREEDHDNFRRSWAKIFFPKLHRKCTCTGCNEDKRVQEFFTRKRYWWTSRTL